MRLRYAPTLTVVTAMLRRKPPCVPAANTANTKKAQKGLLVPSVHTTMAAPKRTSHHAVTVARRRREARPRATTWHTVRL